MSHYYARIPQSARRTMPTARGHRSTGIAAEAFGWNGGARVSIRHVDGADVVTVERIGHPETGAGVRKVLCRFRLTDTHTVTEGGAS